MLAIVGFVCAPRVALAQSFKVGSFLKKTSGAPDNCPAPCPQTVPHGLSLAPGQTPSALILWTNSRTTVTPALIATTSYVFGFGFTDGTNSGSLSTSSLGATSSLASFRRMQSKALTIITTGSSLATAEADMSPVWDDTNFYLNWTVNDANAYIVHFLAIGGSGVQAKFKSWPKPTSTGLAPVNLIGFQPDLVLHMYAIGNNGLASPGTDILGNFALGVMDAGGDQWVNSFTNNSTGAKANTQRGQQAGVAPAGACIYAFNDALTVNNSASFSSMDPDGFTVNFTTASSSSPTIFSLALKGVNVQAGSFLKATAVGAQVQPVGFPPSAVLVSSFGDVAQGSPVAHTHVAVGASDGATQGSAGFWETDNVKPTVVFGADKTSKVFMKGNVLSSSIVAEADLSSFDAVGSASNPTGGFTLGWTTNDAVATQMLYLALGPLDVSAVTLTSFTATRLPDGKMRLDWHTGHEVDNVGFRVYRVQNGQRVRITSSLVPGTALIGIGRGASLGNRTYSWSDAAPPSKAGLVQYWLEDLHRHGRSRWHGPIVAGMAGSHKDR